MTKKLAVARFWFEGNAFAPLPTDLAAFQGREWAKGEAALAGARGAAIAALSLLVHKI